MQSVDTKQMDVWDWCLPALMIEWVYHNYHEFCGVSWHLKTTPVPNIPQRLPMPCSLVILAGKGRGGDVSPCFRAHALTAMHFQVSWLQPRGWGTCRDVSNPCLRLAPSILSIQTRWFSKGWISFQLFQASAPSSSSLSHLPDPCANAAVPGTGSVGLVGTRGTSCLPWARQGGVKQCPVCKSHRRNYHPGGGSAALPLWGISLMRSPSRGARENTNGKNQSKWNLKREILWFLYRSRSTYCLQLAKCWKIW